MDTDIGVVIARRGDVVVEGDRGGIHGEGQRLNLGVNIPSRVQTTFCRMVHLKPV